MTATVDSVIQPWADHYWWSGDGVRLHARIYPCARHPDLPPIICMPGLTRNARDFDLLAPLLAANRRVIAVDFRGRGDSGFAKDATSYVPLTYVQDMVALFESLSIDRFAAVGTSLGGLVAMLLAANLPGRLLGCVLNDVGPELQAAGLARIRTYVGVSASHPTWMHAARHIAVLNEAFYPGFGVHDWLKMAHRTHRLTPQGRIVADYDKQIAAPFRLPGGEAGVDLWPAFRALNAGPLLVLHGGLSDVLSSSGAQRMVGEIAGSVLCEIPAVGHAPTLDEPKAVAAIKTWLKRLPA